MKAAVITGASSGIGLALANEFAKQGHPLFLTARVHAELRDIAREISQNYGVEVQTLAQDLEKPGAAQNIFESARTAGFDTGILINNAGLGFKGKFSEIPIENYMSILRVNVEAVLRLSRLFLPQMIKRKAGRLVNIASIAGFEPGPLLAVYHASKAFVLSLTEALVVETEHTGVSVTAICPGATDTDFFPKAHMMDTRAFQKTGVMAPQDVAAKAYKAIMNGDPLWVAGGMNKSLVFSRRFVTLKKQAAKNKKFYEDVTTPQTRKRHRGDFEEKAARSKRLAKA